MWPEPGEALDRTVLAEQAIEDLYAEALRRWAPTIRQRLLPDLSAAITAAADDAPAEVALPADPNAVADAQAQSSWEAIAAVTILAGVSLLWAAATIEAMEALGIPTPEVPEDFGYAAVTPEPAVLRIVDKAVGDMKREEVLYAAAQVETSAPLRAARDAQTDQIRQEASKAPASVQVKIEGAVRDAGKATDPAAAIAEQRDAAAAAADPAGTEMRTVAREAGMQAAGVLNHAVVVAAQQSEEADDLQKFWIATLDGKTRPTHWAAEGQAVPLAGHFTVGGEQMFCPGDETASAAEWKNCRCRLGIKHKDEPLPDEVDRHTERLEGRDSTAINRDGRTQKEEIERRADEGNIRARDDSEGIGRYAAGGWAAPSEQENDVTMSKFKATPATLAAKQRQGFAADADTGADDEPETFLTFTDAVFAVIGAPTSDGRMFAPDCEMTWRDLPLPLQWCEEAEGGHYGSTTVGVIEKLAIKDGKLLGSGFLLNSEAAADAVPTISHGVSNPSVDLGEYEYCATYIDGTLVTDENYDPELTVYFTFIKAEIVATTLVAIPAFGETNIVLNAERETREPALVASMVEALTASAAPYKPPVYDPALFADPKLTQPTRLTMTEDGHIFGHIAAWTDRHRSPGMGHMKPPKSKTNYEHFHSAPGVHLSDGTTLPVGRLTVGIGHAPTLGISNASAQAHYDNPEACFAFVRAGEDKHGIWISGVAAPWATPEKVQMGLSSALSGDWRPFNNHYELVAVLAVNTPGFLCRGRTDRQGKPLAMVASLGLPPQTEAGGIGHLTFDDIKAAVAEAFLEQQQAAERLQRQESALARARDAVGDPPPELTPTERIGRILERV